MRHLLCRKDCVPESGLGRVVDQRRLGPVEERLGRRYIPLRTETEIYGVAMSFSLRSLSRKLNT